MDLAVYKAAKEGNVDFLSAYGDRFQQILTATKNTVLHIYVASPSPTKSVTVIEKILDMCWPLLMWQNDRGETALNIAAKHGTDNEVRQLLAWAALHPYSLDKGVSFSPPPEELIVQRLIRKTNKDKDTALHEAVRFNRLYVVDLLTAVDPNFYYCPNDAGETPLYLAAERGHRDMVSKILGNCSCPAYEGPGGTTALHIAVIYNDERIIKELLETKKMKRVLTQVADERGWTPLHFAALFGHTSAVKQLLNSDKSAAYAGDNDGRTALHVAASKGHIDIVKELIYHCPDCCEMVDRKRRNVLHYSIENNQIPLVDYFVGLDPLLSNVLINGKDDDGNTPFHKLVASLYEGELVIVPLERINGVFKFINNARVDKMAFNKQNLTAHDMILAGDGFSLLKKAVEVSIEANNARRGHRTISDQSNVGMEAEVTAPNIEELKDAHLVVATLIATVAFAAGFTMPGGYEGDQGEDQGFAVLTRNASFNVFVITNTIAFLIGSSSVLMHLCMAMMRKEQSTIRGVRAFKLEMIYTVLALIALVIAFITGTYAVLGHSPGLAITVCVLGCCMFPDVMIYSKKIAKLFRLPR